MGILTIDDDVLLTDIAM